MADATTTKKAVQPAAETTETAPPEPQELSAEMAAAKQRDYERQTTADQRKAAEEKPVTFTLPSGTKVSAPQAIADKLSG